VSENASLGTSLHVVRTVRRAQFAGQEASSTAGGGVPDISLLTNAMSMALAVMSNPLMLALLVPVIAATATAPFIMSGQLVLPDLSGAGIPYADIQRQWTLQKVFGSTEGKRIWDNEWSTRTMMVDLRAKMP
jgi:hypothetical protein